MSRYTVTPSFLALCLAMSPVLHATALRGEAPSAANASIPHSAAVRQQLSRRMPVLFVANEGQAPAGTLYTAQAAGMAVSLGRAGVTLLRRTPQPASRAADHETASSAGADFIRPRPGSFAAHWQTIEFEGENPAVSVEPMEKQTALSNFFLGGDRKRWVSNASTYARVRYHDLWPGIDMVFYSHDGQLEYDFVVAAGADPNQIRLKIRGNDAFAITNQGDLRMGAGKDVVLHRPLLYQNIGNGKKVIAGKFMKTGVDTVGFRFDAYDKTRTFVIDPSINLLYSTYIGGVDEDDAYGMTLDAAGNTYLVGLSPSQNFPVTANAYSAVDPEAGIYFAVVLKFDPSGTLLYATGLGGEGSAAFGQANYGYAIAVDPSGNAWVGGTTSTNDFPVTSGAVQSTPSGSQDAFLSELSPDGSSLLYSSYFGGTGANFINSMVANSDGSLWMAGGTTAGGLPVTANGVQTKPNGVDNYFVAKVVPTSGGSVQIPYLTYIGGSNASESVPISAGGGALAVDSAGNVYLAGMTFSADYPVTSNAWEKPFALEGGCGFGPTPNSVATLTKFSPNLSSMLYSTVIGGKTESSSGGTEADCNQAALSIHLDGSGNIWLTGTTGESDFPVTSNAVSSQLNTNGSAGVDYFLFELSADGSTQLYGSYLGGSGYDYGDRAAWDSSGNIWIVGNSNSKNFPVTSNAYQSTNAASGAGGTNVSLGYNVTLTELNPTATQILYSTYLGGDGNDCEEGNCQIAIDRADNIHLAGATTSDNFPVTPDAMQTLIADGGQRYNNSGDMFYTVLGTGIIATVSPTTGGNTGDTTVTITGSGIQSGATCELVLNGTTIVSTSATVNSTGTSITCTFALNGATVGSYALEVVNPNGDVTFTANNTFTVEGGGESEVWTNLVGRSVIRASTPSTFTLEYGNSGDTDAIFVPVWIVLPTTLTVSYTPATIGAVDGYPAIDYSSVPQYFDIDGQRYVGLVVPKIAAGKSYSLSLQIEGDTQGSFTIESYANVPYYTAEAALKQDLSFVSSASLRGFDPATANSRLFKGRLRPAATSGGGSSAVACLSDLWQTAWDLVPGSGIGNCGGSLVGFALSLIAQNMDTLNGGQSVSIGSFAYGAATGPLAACAANLVKDATPLKYVAAALNGYKALQDCSPYFAGPLAGALGKIASSLDPNEKSGTAGDGSAQQYVNDRHPLAYNIAFENQATATLPAATVVVTDQLDSTKVDPSTVSLGPISWGASNTITPPSGITSYATTYTPSGVTNYVVRVQGSVNTNSNLLKWTFQTIDPTTGQPPSDTTIGFLPPDADGVEGQGSVVFHVSPRSGLNTGTQISNTATVIFDANAPINTKTWTNTLDVTAPSSAVVALPAETTATSFTVSWSGTDQGSGIGTYDIYTSTNGAAFTLWLSGVTATSATFTGSVGSTYAFLSQATDNVGNVEALRTSADTTSEIVASLPVDFSVVSNPSSASVAPGSSATYVLSVTPQNGFSAAVSFGCSGLPSEATCSFSPSTVTPSGTVASTTTMTVTTTASSQALLVNPSATGGMLAACVLVSFFRRRVRGLWVLLILWGTLAAMASIGCGGGNHSSTGSTNSGTPAGTSTITITATSGSGSSAITHTSTVTLTIQ